jgi:nuclear GTP-binding protein
VLNKIDVIPRANAQSWLRYLRHTTLPFRSTTSAQRTHLSSTTTPALLRMIKAYNPHTQSITVVGYPNVGKSSLINSLKRAKVCPVASQLGHMRNLQSVQLKRSIRIVDSPVSIFDDDARGMMLRNVVRVEDVDDPIAVLEEILARTHSQTLRDINNLQFLTMLALTTGRLNGGTPDILTSAGHVLIDWNHQKIPYYSKPPAIHRSSVPSTATRAEKVG